MFENQTWVWIFKLINNGVPPEMPAEEAKYIQISNICVVLLGLFTGAIFAIGALLERNYSFFLLVVLATSMLIPLLYLIRKGYSAIAVAGTYIFLNLYQVLMTGFVDDKSVHGYFNFIAFAVGPTIFLPRPKRRTMISLVALSLACCILSLFLRNYFGHSLPLHVLAAAKANPAIYLQTGLALLIVTFTNRFFLDRAETKLISERDKVARLANQLKHYLPHQFVESLAGEEREAGMDYRRKKLTIFFSDV